MTPPRGLAAGTIKRIALFGFLAVALTAAVWMPVLFPPTAADRAQRHADALASCALHAVEHGAEATDARRRCADLGNGQ